MSKTPIISKSNRTEKSVKFDFENYEFRSAFAVHSCACLWPDIEHPITRYQPLDYFIIGSFVGSSSGHVRL